ncbi:hypothetical protein HK100_012776, partial [Physocladia obscura]
MSHPRTTGNEYQAMLNWVEVPKNFQLVVGAAVTKAKMVSGSTLTEQSAFVAMAAHVNHTVKVDWSPKTARSRYQSWILSYNRTKKKDATTGFGLTEDDQKNEHEDTKGNEDDENNEEEEEEEEEDDGRSFEADKDIFAGNLVSENELLDEQKNAQLLEHFETMEEKF